MVSRWPIAQRAQIPHMQLVIDHDTHESDDILHMSHYSFHPLNLAALSSRDCDSLHRICPVFRYMQYDRTPRRGRGGGSPCFRRNCSFCNEISQSQHHHPMQTGRTLDARTCALSLCGRGLCDDVAAKGKGRRGSSALAEDRSKVTPALSSYWTFFVTDRLCCCFLENQMQRAKNDKPSILINFVVRGLFGGGVPFFFDTHVTQFRTHFLSIPEQQRSLVDTELPQRFAARF
jgi:hypothetical protein